MTPTTFAGFMILGGIEIFIASCAIAGLAWAILATIAALIKKAENND